MMERPLIYIFTAILLFLSTVPGCASFEPDSCICTTEDRMYAVHIRNGSHVPIDSLVTRSTIKRTGKTYVRSHEGDVYPGAWRGHYSVLADDATNDISTSGDTVLFHAENSQYSIDGTYIFNTDDCRCHIFKVAGPDTITAVAVSSK
jgi:hypothetical protein